MFEAVVTLVDYYEPTDEQKLDGVEKHAFTRLYRLEFATREGFEAWLELTQGVELERKTTWLDGFSHTQLDAISDKIGCMSAETMHGQVL
jgi:hypothetical protein